MCVSVNAFAQESYSYNDSKNLIEIIYSPFFSKTNFHKFPDYASSSFERLYESQKPTKPIIAFSYGINYKRKFKNKYFISIGVNYSKNGQRSPVFFSTKGISDSGLFDRENYGGKFYRIIYHSYDFPLILGVQIHANRKIKHYIKGAVIFNVYDKASASSYTVNRQTGNVRASVLQSFLSFSEGGLLKRFESSVEKGLWRLGFSIGNRIEYLITPHIFVSGEFDFRYYNSLHEEYSTAGVVSGNIINFGLSLGGGVAF